MSRKGGTGKTTLCTITAAALHNRTGKKITVIDADPQNSIADLQSLEDDPDKGFDVVRFAWDQNKAFERFIDEVEKASKHYDFVFIDSPGRMEGKDVELILNASDFVFIPLIASPIDVMSTRQFLDFIGPVVEAEQIPVYGIINKRDRSLEHSLLNDLEGHRGLEIMTCYISNLVRYKRDLSTVTEIVAAADPTDEFNMYIKEFIKTVK